MRRHLFLASIAIAALLMSSVGVAAPAAAKTTDVDVWAEGFCNALDRWQTGATKVRDLLRGVVDNGVTSKASAKAVRAKVVSGFGSASKVAATTSDDIDGLGNPDVPGGAKIRATLVSALSDTGDAFSAARSSAAKAPTDPSKFQTAMRTIYQQVDGDLARPARASRTSRR